MEKLAVAVLFGGPSSEHDVSVLTGLQVLEALDPAKYDAFPVYIGLDGQWWVGDALRERKNYIPDAAMRRQLTRVRFEVGAAREGGRWWLREVGGGLLKRGKAVAFDVAIPALHGSWGEDGTLQGVLASEGVPLAGGGVSAMGLTINKAWTMEIAAACGLPVVESLLVWRGEELDEKAVKGVGKFPLFVKPNHLGSSIGARVVRDMADLRAALGEVFRLDYAALVQECVPNLLEYNVAVRRDGAGQIVTSAIERPIRSGDSLDFKDKYLSGGGLDKLGQKLGAATGGMASATRVLNPPELRQEAAIQLREWATELFRALDLAGCPRLDFLCDEKTGDIYFNEINPLPGSFGYFLWEGADEPVGFTALLDGMVEEARSRMRSRARVVDPVATGGGIFRKRG